VFVEPYDPGLVVHGVVVGIAQQNAVLDAGFAAVTPANDVVSRRSLKGAEAEEVGRGLRRPPRWRSALSAGRGRATEGAADAGGPRSQGGLRRRCEMRQAPRAAWIAALRATNRSLRRAHRTESPTGGTTSTRDRHDRSWGRPWGPWFASLQTVAGAATDRGEPVALVLSANNVRRHLTTGPRAMGDGDGADSGGGWEAQERTWARDSVPSCESATSWPPLMARARPSC
jgi:hypothetical protein